MTTTRPLHATAADWQALKTAISAAESLRIDPKRRPVIDRIKATLKRANYPWSDSTPLDLQKIDACFAAAGNSISISDRLATKIDAKRCQLLPAYSS